ncbi:ABC transporter permease [Candidatus Actinomarina]|jgi:simple sugar transport system permease protein|nr:ABC transporter permease [Candidatus Actinomarina sp.]
MEWIEIIDVSLFRSLLRSTAPIAIVGMAAAVCSAAGVLNIGLEGKMLNAAFAGVAASYYTESMWLGLAAGVIAGIVTSLLFGLLSFTLGADEVLAGLAINIFSLAGTTYMMRTLWGQAGFFSSPRIVGVEPIHFTFLEGSFLEPFLSDFTYSVYLMFFIAFGLHIIFYRTRLGTAIRATGENPEAAEDAGINTVRIKWIVTLFAGVLAGISGLFLSLENLTMFTEGMSAGKGFIGLVASSFGNATPLGTFGASAFFGLGDAIGIRLQGVYDLDSRLILMIPYALTVVVLILIGIRQRLKIRRVSIPEN